MKIRGIRIERLHVKLPRTVLSSSARPSPAALASDAATALARSLRQAGLAVGATPRVHGLDVRVGREEADATGIANAIRASIMRSVDPTGNGK
jgi:hypothetical protein